MTQTSEERFYSEFARKETSESDYGTASDFALGGRYFICDWSMRRQHPPLRFNTIVELGCGAGDHLLYLKKKYQYKRGFGFDLGISEERVVDGCYFKRINLNNRWELEDHSVDVLVAMMVIEHLFDPYFCFREIRRVLSADGRAFVNLPLVTNLSNRMRLLFGYIPITSVPYQRWEKEGHWDGFHLHYFSLQSIYDLARQAGLKVVSVHGVGKFKTVKEFFPSLLCGELSFELRVCPEAGHF